MTFAFRQIDLQFSTAEGQVVKLTGLRCAAIIEAPGGYIPYASLQMRVWGMTLEHMNQFSSTGANLVVIQNSEVTVLAGDPSQPLTQIFLGTIKTAYIDFGSLPDVCFSISAYAGYYNKSTPIASNSYPGAQKAEAIIQALVGQMVDANGNHNWGFKNSSNATAILQDQVVTGSVMDQIQKIAANAKFPMTVDNNTVTIWDNNGSRDDLIVDVSPDTGMVGYPSYWEAGFIVKSLFNPLITNGRGVRLSSSLPKSNGTYNVLSVTHELGTVTADGPWFSTCKLGVPPYVTPN